jgi:hypothetical protein
MNLFIQYTFNFIHLAKIKTINLFFKELISLDKDGLIFSDNS